jgi:hypothetical protein
MKGLMVGVLRAADLDGCDCTNGGVSSTHKHLLLVGEGIPEIFEERDGMPAVVLVKRELWSERQGKRCTYLHVEPAATHGKAWHMAGGNFIHSSDSRFPSDQPISIHDRIE